MAFPMILYISWVPHLLPASRFMSNGESNSLLSVPKTASQHGAPTQHWQQDGLEFERNGTLQDNGLHLGQPKQHLGAPYHTLTFPLENPKDNLAGIPGLTSACGASIHRQAPQVTSSGYLMLGVRCQNSFQGVKPTHL